ncbi:hypothetical protein Pcinc_032475 [Petrolisthes cinctipes]|uniref:Uncharacterized protein n=1 Tax=Petrolisthes cinctipes TaxID=88211 RepID=A0AAE1K2X7_PETCI|nr:hypothetical protein Pcinc_032475 [Petrolisthes cinctipes]
MCMLNAYILFKTQVGESQQPSLRQFSLTVVTQLLQKFGQVTAPLPRRHSNTFPDQLKAHAYMEKHFAVPLPPSNARNVGDCSAGRVLVRKAEHASDIISNGKYDRWRRSSSETKDEVIYSAKKKINGDPQKMHTPVASSLTSNQLHPSSTSITLPKQSTSTQGQLPCEGRGAQVDSPVTPRHTNGKKRSRSTHIPPSSFTTTESVPGPSTSRHASTQRSHPRQHNLTSSKKILPLLFLEDEDSASEPDIISRDEVWLDDHAHSSSSDEDEENENYETAVNLSEVFSFSWSEGSDFVPDQHDFQPNSSGTTRDWPCNNKARENITMLNAYNLWLFKKNFDRSKKPKLHEFVYNVADQLLEDFGEPTTNTRNRLPSKLLPDRAFMNVEEAVAFLYSLSDDEDATAIDITLEPPDDGAESDGDVPSEDIVEVDENIMLLEPKLLDKPPHIELSNRNTCVEPCLSMSSPIGLQPQEELAEPTSQTRKELNHQKNVSRKYMNGTNVG